jgi:REP element-mobilizing transposase RayT
VCRKDTGMSAMKHGEYVLYLRMNFKNEGSYHVYNRGNNKQQIFFCRADYLHFLRLCHKYVAPRSQILAWCLMPNHFHFLLQVDAIGLTPFKQGGNEMPLLSNGFQLLESSYAKMINKRDSRTGSLFQQKTKSKWMADNAYSANAFWYTHYNPVEAGLVMRMQDWEYSSYLDFCNARRTTLCNVELAKNLIGLSGIDFPNMIIDQMKDQDLKHIF